MYRNLALVLSACAVLFSLLSYGHSGLFLFNTYHINEFSQFFKVLLSVGLFLTIYYVDDLIRIESELHAGYYMLIASSTLGLLMVSSAVEFLTMLIALEISCYSIQMLVMYGNKKKGNTHKEDVTFKYTLYRVTATGIMFFGLSYIFGLTHTTYISEMKAIIPDLINKDPLLLAGIVLMMCGVFFKLPLFPFHFMSADVFQGTQQEKLPYLFVLPKIGAVIFLFRILCISGIEDSLIILLLSVISVLSMTLGNLTALVQTDLKRMIAYSSVAHAGYLLIGIITVNPSGMIASMYYLTGFLIMNLACFYVIYHIFPDGQQIDLEKLHGLSQKSPLLAMTLTLGILALAGIPPTLGFTGKILLFTAALDNQLTVIALFAALNFGNTNR